MLRSDYVSHSTTRNCELIESALAAEEVRDLAGLGILVPCTSVRATETRLGTFCADAFTSGSDVFHSISCCAPFLVVRFAVVRTAPCFKFSSGSCSFIVDSLVSDFRRLLLVAVSRVNTSGSVCLRCDLEALVTDDVLES